VTEAEANFTDPVHDVFNLASPAVVRVFAGDGDGSGSLLEGNRIITSWHVVSKSSRVRILFKPAGDNNRPNRFFAPQDMLGAKVVKIDSVRDLALLELDSTPVRTIRPISISTGDAISVGKNVHAIGHPEGEAWTYTWGIVSQVRANYRWIESIGGVTHRATVIQTQTPINPGNSGGPLLSDDAELVGVNAFRTRDAEGLNFAVSAKDVWSFLSTSAVESVPKENCNLSQPLFEGPNDDNTAFMQFRSLQCDGWATEEFVVYFLPDDKRLPAQALFRKTRDSPPHGIVLDESRSGKWNRSLWDVDSDGTFPILGEHPNGELLPASVGPRCKPPSKALPGFTRCSSG